MNIHSAALHRLAARFGRGQRFWPGIRGLWVGRAALGRAGAAAREMAVRLAPESNPARCTPRWHRPATAAPKTLLRPHLGAVHAMRGSALLLGRIVSGGCWRAGDPAVRQEQESRNSPDSVRFLRCL